MGTINVDVKTWLNLAVFFADIVSKLNSPIKFRSHLKFELFSIHIEQMYNLTKENDIFINDNQQL